MTLTYDSTQQSDGRGESAVAPLSQRASLAFLDGLDDMCRGFPLRRLDRREATRLRASTDLARAFRHLNHLLSRADARRFRRRFLGSEIDANHTGERDYKSGNDTGESFRGYLTAKRLTACRLPASRIGAPG